MTRTEPMVHAAEGVRLTVRLTPRATRNAVDGVKVGADGVPALGLRVAAPPVEGAANAALVAMLCDALGLRRVDVTLLAGQTGRVKRLLLRGDPADLTRRLRDWIERSLS